MAFVFNHPDFMWHAFILSAASCSGQVTRILFFLGGILKLVFSFSSIILSPNLVPLYSQSLWQLDLLWQSFFLVLSIHIQLMPLEYLVSSLHSHPLDFESGTRFNKRKRNRLKPIKLKSLRNGHKWPTLTWSQMTTLIKCNYIRCVLSLLLPKSSQPSWN